MINVISHRGYWKKPHEKNMPDAFRRSFSLGFGTETDIRDSLRAGEQRLVISHDVPSGNEIFFEEMLEIAREHDSPLLALNIKSDGLQDLVQDALTAYGYSNYFLFDASVPDLIQADKKGLRCYTRLSEYETVPSLYDAPNVVGVWVDAFQPGRWYDEVFIDRLLSDGKEVALVAPDLHKRLDEFVPYFNWLKISGLAERTGLLVCTDEPERATQILQG